MITAKARFTDPRIILAGIAMALVSLPTSGAAASITKSGLERESAGLAVELDSQDRAVVAGFTQPCDGFGVTECIDQSKLVVARFSTDGRLDRSFGGGDGLATIPLGAPANTLAGLVVRPDDSIVIAGGGRRPVAPD